MAVFPLFHQPFQKEKVECLEGQEEWEGTQSRGSVSNWPAVIS